MSDYTPILDLDSALFSWEPTPGIVSVWANREGSALVWRREGERVTWSRESFRHWLYATTLDDVVHLGAALALEGSEDAARVRVTWREMAGEGGFRYLLAARSERALERAILTGATARLGQRVRGLSELPEYYRVGPTGQYLMASGRSYFRGMRYDELHRLQFDLETTALDPAEGRIFLVALRDSRGLETILEAPEPADEAGLIAELCALIRQRDPDVLENHNLLGFDLPFLHARAARLGVPLLLGRAPGAPQLQRYEEPGGGWGGTRFRVIGRELVDTLDAVRRHDFVARSLPGYGLKAVARAFGVARPERVYLPGATIAATYRDDPERVRRYALDDVAEVDALSQRLMGPAFTLAQLAPRPYERAATAGPAMGILEPMLVRAYLREGAALPPYRGARPAGGASHAGGAAYLFASGVALQVVKADIASLYPSLMRHYAIGPACDRLGTLLAIVGRLTDLRLAHKAAARAVGAETVEGGTHLAMQAAMKLVINAAYGYMGAGHMALFGDPAAADEVTRRGRALLDEVVEALRSRGVALIEADTDGVYFAVPEGWSEGQERALVAEVAATLPAGLALEYEGRYRAMFSHEVKNYALLTYEGELVLRGVALRSSRAEPFGERFLREALGCTMRGDMAGLRAAYLATLAALRSGEMPLAEVATRVRLSKSPERYLKRREKHREFAYEALLAAGRDDWRVGERVHCYRAVGGKMQWLPDEATSEALPPYDGEHYVRALVTSYAARLRKAFEPHDFERLFRPDGQLGLFDAPLDTIQPRWIRWGTGE